MLSFLHPPAVPPYITLHLPSLSQLSHLIFGNWPAKMCLLRSAMWKCITSQSKHCSSHNPSARKLLKKWCEKHGCAGLEDRHVSIPPLLQFQALLAGFNSSTPTQRANGARTQKSVHNEWMDG